jgi:hypothetical protein
LAIMEVFIKTAHYLFYYQNVAENPDWI